MKIFRLITISVFVLISQSAVCQVDLAMWNTLSIEKEFSKKFAIVVDEEVRLKDNLCSLNLLYTNFGASYKPIKPLKISVIYRLIEKYSLEGTFSFRNRLMLDISYKYKISDFTISYRSRLQSEVKSYYSSKKGKLPEWFWRNKFEVKYSYKNYTPFFGAEFRYQIKDPKNEIYNQGWHRSRTFFGVDYDLNSNNTIGAYFLMQREANVVDPESINVIGLQYSLTLPYKKVK